MVLVLLILLWTAVLLPPYLKDRRNSRSFRAVQQNTITAAPTSAQRFLPLESAHSNVVHLHPPAASPLVDATIASPLQAPTFVGPEQQVAGSASANRFANPSTTSQARERRRQVLIGLTGLAFATLILALAVGGAMTPIHIAIDALMVGYVILLVRHRQMATEQASRLEPIRPAVSQVAPTTVQMAPSYLLRSGTGS